MKLNTLSFLTTAVALVAAVPAPEAGKCTFPCLTIFNKCMHEHQGNISLCRSETVNEIPSVRTLSMGLLNVKEANMYRSALLASSCLAVKNHSLLRSRSAI